MSPILLPRRGRKHPNLARKPLLQFFKRSSIKLGGTDASLLHIEHEVSPAIENIYVSSSC